MRDERDYWRAKPLLFGQVREDADVERSLVQRHGRVARALIVASAGCTALSLLDLVRDRVHAIDINPAQVELTERKRALLAEGDVRAIIDLANAGRVDRTLAILRRLLFATTHPRSLIEEMLSLDDVATQRQFYEQRWNTPRWRAATSVAFSQLLMRLGFGGDAARALPTSFAEHIRERIYNGLTRFPLRYNGYVWQAFLGRYPDDTDAALPPYLREALRGAVTASLGKLRTVAGDMSAFTDTIADGSIDFIGLSNIAELSRAYEPLLRSVARIAAPGAIVVVRAILPFPAMPPHVAGLILDAELSRACEDSDRSMICTSFAVYRKG